MNGKMESLALHVARGGKVSAWAKSEGVPLRTAYRWAGAAEFKTAVAGFRREITGRVVGRLVGQSAAAAAEMARLMKGAASEAVRLRAAESVMDRSIAWTEHYDFEARLAALEERDREHRS